MIKVHNKRYSNNMINGLQNNFYLGDKFCTHDD